MADYATLSELKNFVRFGEGTEDDDLMELCITAATAAIDTACATTFPRTEDALVVPAGVRLACLMQASRWYKRRDAAFGVLGSPDMGNMTRLLSKLDPDVAVLLSGFKNNWGAVDGT